MVSGILALACNGKGISEMMESIHATTNIQTSFSLRHPVDVWLHISYDANFWPNMLVVFFSFSATFPKPEKGCEFPKVGFAKDGGFPNGCLFRGTSDFGGTVNTKGMEAGAASVGFSVAAGFSV